MDNSNNKYQGMSLDDLLNDDTPSPESTKRDNITKNIIQSSKEPEDRKVDRIVNKDSNKRKMLVAGFVAALCLLLTGVLLFKPFGILSNEDKQGRDRDTTASQTDPSNNTSGNNNNNPGDPSAQPTNYMTTNIPKQFWEDKGKKYPEPTPSWAGNQYSPQSYDNSKEARLNKDGSHNPNSLSQNIIDTYSDTEMASSSGRLPSESAGYTSDQKKSRLSDGTLNPMYSYWTAETFQSDSGALLTRILNPDFGGWSSYQYSKANASKSFNINLYSDMFTRKYYNDNLKTPYSQWLPFYADWNANDYGMGNQFLTNGPRWLGVIQTSTSTWKYDDKTKQYMVIMNMKIKYVAWGNQQNKLEKNANLTLELVPNLGDYQNSSSYKVLINKATLKVE